MPTELADLHLAELHARAAELGIEGYRLLRRDELVRKIDADDGSGRRLPTRRRAPEVDYDRDTDELEAIPAAGPAAEEGPPRDRQRAPRRRGGRGRGGRQREKLASGESGRGRERGEPHGEEETRPVSGVLEVTRQRHGFLRLSGEREGEDDVYVSASQVRRCELEDGDEVSGPARDPRRGERHPALVHVDLVNGEPPVPAPPDADAGSAGPRASREPDQPAFETLTPVPPHRRFEIGADAELLARAADRLAPLAFGQRVLIRATPRSGRTTLLRALAPALGAAEKTELVVLLIDERPEEMPAWREAVPEAELIAATADLSPPEQRRAAEEALESARRRVEAGVDVVLIVDSLTRLAVAADGVTEVKRLFGSGRELEGEDTGSLTVIATVLADGDDGGSAERAVATTENALIVLDPSLAEQGIVPALRAAECRSTGEDKLLSDEELDALRGLRAELAGLVAPEAAALLREKLG